MGKRNKNMLICFIKSLLLILYQKNSLVIFMTVFSYNLSILFSSDMINDNVINYGIIYRTI